MRIRRILLLVCIGVCCLQIVIAPSYFFRDHLFLLSVFLAVFLAIMDSKWWACIDESESRTGRILRWCSLGTCALVVVIWIISAWWPINCFGNTYFVTIANGRLRTVRYEGPPAEIHRELLIWQREYRSAEYGLGWEGLLGGLFLTRDDLHEEGGRSICQVWTHEYKAPAGIVLLLVGFPTIILWRRQLRKLLPRKPGPGCCKKCGYNLTGNVSGVCPECGVLLTKEQKMKLGAADGCVAPDQPGAESVCPREE